MYKGIIFDLDGTLLDTIDDLTDAVNHILNKYQYPQRSKEEITKFIGNGAKLLIKRALPIEALDQLDIILNEYKSYYDEHSMIKTKPYHGIIEMLVKLQEKLKIGVVSNKPDPAVQILVKHYFNSDFTAVIGESEQTPKKPNPASVLKVIELMKLNPKDVIFVGDSEVDIETARNVGCDVIAVTWGFRSKDVLQVLKPTYIIDNPKEILAIVEV